jgi:hypothetical protein
MLYEGREKGRWPASTSVALAEHPSSLTPGQDLSLAHPKWVIDAAACWGGIDSNSR